MNVKHLGISQYSGVRSFETTLPASVVLLFIYSQEFIVNCHVKPKFALSIQHLSYHGARFMGKNTYFLSIWLS